MVEVIYAEFVDSDVMVGSPRPSDAEITLYPRSSVDNGYVPTVPNTYRPPVGNPIPIYEPTLATETYTTPSGARAWRNTGYEDAFFDTIARDPMHGLDELAAARAASRAAPSRLVQATPYIGDIAGGAIEGYLAYGETGSLAIGVGTGVGSAVGGIAGSSVGAAVGSLLGPGGTVAGAIAGGIVGSAVGSALGGALGRLLDPPPSTNPNDFQQPGEYPFTGGQGNGIRYSATWEILRPNGTWLAVSGELNGPLTFSSALEPGDSDAGCQNGTTFKRWRLQTNGVGGLGLASGCGAQYRNLKVTPMYGIPEVPGNPDPILEPYDPTQNPNAPRVPGPSPIRLPQPIPNPNPGPTGRRNPTGYPTPFPVPNPIGYPTPAPGPQPRPEPNPTTDPTKQPDPYPPDELPPGDEPPEPNDCNICDKLDGIDGALKGQFESTLTLQPCEDSEEQPLVLGSAGAGLGGISAHLDMINTALEQIWDKVKCPNENDLALPESWAIKTARTTGQYVIIWKPTDGSRSRWSSSIPHPKHTTLAAARQGFTPITFKRGDVMLNIQNEDNTHVILNVESEQEGNRMAQWVASLTDDAYAATQYPKITKGMKARIGANEVKPTMVKYFATGQTSLVPDWVFRVKDDGSTTI